MDPGQQWGCSSFRTPMDSGAYNQDYRIFDAYLYDYLLKRNLHTTAQIFMQEAQIGDIRDLLHIDSPGGFLFDWWTIFYDSFTARFSGSQGNHTALFSQDGQSSSMYDLPPLQPFPQDPELMPLVPGSAPVPQGCTILESSSLVYGTTGVPPVWPASHGSPQVTGSSATPPARSTCTVSPLVSGAGEIPSVWWDHEGALVPATEQAPMPVKPMLNYQSPGSPSAIVLRTGNLNSVSPALFPQPRPSRRGIRRGASPNDPIDVETPVASPASAPRGRRPRRQLESQSRVSHSRRLQNPIDTCGILGSVDGPLPGGGVPQRPSQPDGRKWDTP
ncbi:unnamed protein product [Rhodiola kirilowii]